MACIQGEIVKDSVTEAGANYKANYEKQEEIIYCIDINVEPFFSYLMFYQKIGGQEAKDIHDPIPAYLKGAQRNYCWVYGWIGQHLSSPGFKISYSDTEKNLKKTLLHVFLDRFAYWNWFIDST